ncbi:MAG TPA: cob(I)yrinic acid a,c-diamide adenosyltransferase [Actinopolymorphaceae bacterium]
MVNLTRIYTRAGDDGTTRLVDNSLVDKTDTRLVAYADVDEANAQIGAVLALGDPPDDIRGVLRAVQNDLFDVGADLGNPGRPAAAPGDTAGRPEGEPLRVRQDYVDRLERWCDRFNERVPPLRSFVLPGGTPAAALLHIARTAVRRAERSAWTAVAEHRETMNLVAVTYLNRLSDLLFILARVANAGQDVLWDPGAGRDDEAAPDEATGDTAHE